MVVRARRSRGGKADTVVKLRPVDPALLDPELRRMPGFKIEVDGISDKASDLIAILEASPYFTGVEFTAPTTKYLASQERFSLRMRLEQ